MNKKALIFGAPGVGALLKSHVDGYVRGDGVQVKEHETRALPKAIRALKQSMHPHSGGDDPGWSHTASESHYRVGDSRARRAWCEDHLVHAGFRPHHSDWSVLKHPDGHVAEMNESHLRIVHKEG